MGVREQGIALLMAESTIHCGVGQDVGPIDLPIQRDQVTRTPVIYGSSLKGAWRDAVHVRDSNDSKWAKKLFGPRVDAEDPSQKLERGAVGVGEARVLFYPVASVQRLFAYVTCPGELARFHRACTVAEIAGPQRWPGESPVEDEALVSSNQLAISDEPLKLGLREFTLSATQDDALGEVGAWVGDHLFKDKALEYWRKALKNHAIMVSDDQFRTFVDPCIVVTRVQLEEGTKTVKDQMLLTEEVLPADVVMWAGLHAEPDKLDELIDVLPQVITVGGDETVGRGAMRHVILKGGQS